MQTRGYTSDYNQQCFILEVLFLGCCILLHCVECLAYLLLVYKHVQYLTGCPWQQCHRYYPSSDCLYTTLGKRNTGSLMLFWPSFSFTANIHSKRQRFHIDNTFGRHFFGSVQKKINQPKNLQWLIIKKHLFLPGIFLKHLLAQLLVGSRRLAEKEEKKSSGRGGNVTYWC